MDTGWMNDQNIPLGDGGLLVIHKGKSTAFQYHYDFGEIMVMPGAYRMSPCLHLLQIDGKSQRLDVAMEF